MNTMTRRAAAWMAVLPLLGACAAGAGASRAHSSHSPAALAAPLPAPAETSAGEEIAVRRLSPAAATPRRIDLRVDRLWSEDGTTYATVSVRNLASFDLAKVTVSCAALDPDRSPADVIEHTLLPPAEGPMPPGAERTAILVLEARSREVRSVSCEARAL